MKKSPRIQNDAAGTPAERAERTVRARQDEIHRLAGLRAGLLRHRGIIGCGTDFTAALIVTDGRIGIAGDDRWGQSECAAWTDVRAVFCGPDYVLGLSGNGCVSFAGRDDTGMREGAAGLSSVTLLACGRTHAAALQYGGRVRCIGPENAPCTRTGDWTDVVDVCCGRGFTAGLTADGHVLCAGGSRLLRMKLAEWSGIAGLYADPDGSVVMGITAEGRPVSTARLPRRVKSWSNLASLAVCGKGLFGITPGGSLLAARRLPRAYRDDMYDVAAIAAGPRHVMTVDRSGHVEPLGLSVRNGRVLAVRPDGVPDFGETDPTGGTPLFEDFEAVCAAEERDEEDRQRALRRRQERMTEADRLSRRLSCGDRLTALVTGSGRVSATGGLTACAGWDDVLTVSCGRAHLLAMLRDGRVFADGNDTDGCCGVSDWTNVRSVLAVGDRSLALTRDGRVLAAGADAGILSEWRDVTLLRGSASCTVGLDKHGRLLTAGTGLSSDALRGPVWENLADVRISERLLVGLSADGCAAALTLPGGSPVPGLDEVNGWHDVRTISVGREHVAALCTGGRVLSAGRNDRGQCGTDEWEHMAVVCCTDDATLGLDEDGNVFCAGTLAGTTVRVGEPLWRDVCAIAAGRAHAAALTSRGRVTACGLDADGQCTGTVLFPPVQDMRRADGRLSGGPDRDGRAETADAGKTEDKSPRIDTAGCIPAYLPRRFACGLAHTVTVGADGRAEIAYDSGTRETPWSGVTSAACASGCTVAAAQGRAVCLGQDRDMAKWIEGLNRHLNPSGSVGIPKGSDTYTVLSCSYGRVVGLRGDGRVYTTGLPGAECNVTFWRRVADVACGPRHVAAVTTDGRCLAAGSSLHGECDVRGEDWRTLIFVSCGDRHTAALRRDGRVVAAGDNANGQCSVSDLTDVVSLVCLPEATVCVHRDGHVTVRGSDLLAAKTESLTDIVAVNGLEHRLMLADRTGRIFCV